MSMELVSEILLKLASSKISFCLRYKSFVWGGQKMYRHVEQEDHWISNFTYHLSLSNLAEFCPRNYCKLFPLVRLVYQKYSEDG